MYQGGCCSGSSFSGQNCCFVCRECMDVEEGCIFLWLRVKPGRFRQQEVAKDPALAVRCCHLL